jgi:hypothetical protein
VLFVRPLDAAGRHWFTTRIVTHVKNEPDIKAAATAKLTPGTTVCSANPRETSRGSAIASNTRVTRSYQYARWSNGSTHLWIGRRKQPGRGEGSSGLRFGVVEPVKG